MKITKKEKERERRLGEYNQGRLEADRKWVQAIDDRIEELEREVGIPELKKLRKDTRYRWKE